jgi:cephalosporin hydroxylase
MNLALTERQVGAEIDLQRGMKVLRVRGLRALIDESFALINRRLFGNFYVRQFHGVWYYSDVGVGKIHWFGVEIWQNPMDMWTIQEMIFEIRPNFIIETGTNRGGTALFFASMCDLLQHGHVITIDTEDKSTINHPRVTKIIGDSTADETVSRVLEIAGDSTCLVFLDSAHNKQHVLREMESYQRFVKIGNYMVVADTNVNGHPVVPWFREHVNGKIYRDGPMEAVMQFLKQHPEFTIDKSKEKNIFTQFPNGFLLRQAEPKTA